MPNWCFNSVNIEGSEKEIEKFKKYVSTDTSAFSLNKIIPMPDDIYRGNLGEEEKKKYGEKNWYDWSWENWGTKWDINEKEIEVESINDGKLQYTFETAWSPPDPVWKHLVNKFPKLKIEWFYQDESEEVGHILPKLSPQIFI
tara:strand:+ start:115 stop:543 length:429 start_codon:yes stop_codon:yes gene_type:complete